jgi:hypothetical protein
MRLNNINSYPVMIILACVVGLLSIALQFLPGWELLAFMLSVAVLGGLIGGQNGYSEADRQRLGHSYKSAYEWLLLFVMAGYAANELALWLHFEGTVSFLNNHWPGLVLAAMCLLMGIAGFQKKQQPVS